MEERYVVRPHGYEFITVDTWCDEVVDSYDTDEAATLWCKAQNELTYEQDERNFVSADKYVWYSWK